jgi:PAS domain S-box-containing protein
MASQRPEDFGIGRLFWVTSDAIVGADVESERIVLWNPAAAEMFGYSASEAVGMPLVELVAPELWDAHLSGIGRYRDGRPAALVGRPRVEVPAVAKDGRRLDVALTLTDVSSDGARRHVVAVIRDVSDMRRAQLDLERMNDSMRQFIAAASHDLRTPLAAILGFAQMLTADGESLSAHQRRDFHDAILRGATTASRLIHDLLTLSQIEAGAVASHHETVAVAEAAAEAAQMAGVDASLSVGPELVVLVDRHHLERMLMNLLSNARRYGHPPIEVRAVRRGHNIDILVVDAGNGVPDHFVPRLFDRFARARPSEGDGTGLGLSIVRGLAAAHGGDAFYQTSSHGGAEFGIRLPAAL